MTTDKIRIRKGVRQGDTVSPKLFTLAMENIFNTLLGEYRYQCERNSSKPPTIRIHELKDMLSQLNEPSIKFALKINLSKTNITSDVEDILIIDGSIL